MYTSFTLDITSLVTQGTNNLTFTHANWDCGVVDSTKNVQITNVGGAVIFSDSTVRPLSCTQSITYTFTVQDFTISASPTGISIPQTQFQTSTITLTSLGGYSGTVTLLASSNAPRDPNGVQFLYWDFSTCSTTDCQTSATLASGGTATSTIYIFTYSNTPTRNIHGNCHRHERAPDSFGPYNCHSNCVHAPGRWWR